ncbi:MAG: sulfatase, partial [Chloroflexi bacterium]|nr:sulfatase [Chloroflexota bacterium]
LEDETLIIFVADHGEPMGKGEHGHGIMRKCRPWPYEELAHIPFIIKGPGLPAGKRIASFVHSCDVAPTVTDWLGLGVHREMQGKSLLPLAGGEVDKVWDFAIAGYHRYSWSIITEDWSFIHWLKEDEPTFAESIHQIYGVESAKAASYLVSEEFLDASPGAEGARKAAALSEEERMHKEAATLDGEDQWTCTPGAVAQVPERDELYDRRKDPFQLKNIADKHPQVARDLLRILKGFMAEMRCT